MAKNSRGSRNNNPEGRNQYSSDWMGTVRDRPVTTAAAAAGAVAAGVFLWSRRNEISDQIGRLSDQITDWAEDMRANRSSNEFELAEGSDDTTTTGSSGTAGRKSASSRTGTTASRNNGSPATSQSNQTTAGLNQTA
jgi:hypothetical protein